MCNWIDTVSAVGSAVAAVASVVVAIIVWRAQSKQEKRTQGSTFYGFMSSKTWR